MLKNERLSLGLKTEQDAALFAMRRFYNIFPYPGRPLFVMPQAKNMGLSHMGFAALLANGDVALARRIWKAYHTSERMRRAFSGTLSGRSSSAKRREEFLILEAAAQYKVTSSSARILLAGCGTDEPVLYAALHPHARIDAVDLSMRSLIRAALKLICYVFLHPFRMNKYLTGLFRKTRFHCADVQSYVQDSLENKNYDHIVCYGVLHHQARPREFFISLMKALRAGGTLRFMVYSASGRNLERSSQRLIGASTRARASSFLFAFVWTYWRVVQMRIWLTLRRFSQLHDAFKKIGLISKNRSTAGQSRLSYIGNSNALVADALLHPSDPGLSLRAVDRLIKYSNAKLVYCCAQTFSKNWIVGIEEPLRAWEEILQAEKNADISSNIEFILQK